MNINNKSGKIYFFRTDRSENPKDCFTPLLGVNSNFDNLKSLHLGKGKALGITKNNELLEWKFEKRKNSNQIPTLETDNSESSFNLTSTKNKSKKNDFYFLLSKPSYLFHKMKITLIRLNKTMCLSLDINGNVFVWGKNKEGLLGLGYEVNEVCTPTILKGLENITDISLSDYHAVALNSNGIPFSWGLGKYGELGLESSIYNPIPHQMNTESQYLRVFCGNLITCFLDFEGHFSYFGVVIKQLRGHNSTITVKNLLKDQNNDTKKLFLEKEIEELEDQKFKEVIIGNGFIGLLSKTGNLFTLEYNDILTMLYSKYYLYNIVVSKNQIFGLAKDSVKISDNSNNLTNNNIIDNNLGNPKNEEKIKANYYLCKWISKSSSENEVYSEKWNSTIWKFNEDFRATIENCNLLDSNDNRNILLLLDSAQKYMTNLNTSVVNPNKKILDFTGNNDSLFFDNTMNNNNTTILDNLVLNKKNLPNKILEYEGEFDDSFNLKFKRTKAKRRPMPKDNPYIAKIRSRSLSPLLNKSYNTSFQNSIINLNKSNLGHIGIGNNNISSIGPNYSESTTKKNFLISNNNRKIDNNLQNNNIFNQNSYNNKNNKSYLSYNNNDISEDNNNIGNNLSSNNINTISPIINNTKKIEKENDNIDLSEESINEKEKELNKYKSEIDDIIANYKNNKDIKKINLINNYGTNKKINKENNIIKINDEDNINDKSISNNSYKIINNSDNIHKNVEHNFSDNDYAHYNNKELNKHLSNDKIIKDINVQPNDKIGANRKNVIKEKDSCNKSNVIKTKQDPRDINCNNTLSNHENDNKRHNINNVINTKETIPEGNKKDIKLINEQNNSRQNKISHLSSQFDNDNSKKIINKTNRKKKNYNIKNKNNTLNRKIEQINKEIMNNLKKYFYSNKNINFEKNNKQKRKNKEINNENEFEFHVNRQESFQNINNSNDPHNIYSSFTNYSELKPFLHNSMRIRKKCLSERNINFFNYNDEHIQENSQTKLLDNINNNSNEINKNKSNESLKEINNNFDIKQTKKGMNANNTNDKFKVKVNNIKMKNKENYNKENINNNGSNYYNNEDIISSPTFNKEEIRKNKLLELNSSNKNNLEIQNIDNEISKKIKSNCIDKNRNTFKSNKDNNVEYNDNNNYNKIKYLSQIKNKENQINYKEIKNDKTKYHKNINIVKENKNDNNKTINNYKDVNNTKIGENNNEDNYYDDNNLNYFDHIENNKSKKYANLNEENMIYNINKAYYPKNNQNIINNIEKESNKTLDFNYNESRKKILNYEDNNDVNAFSVSKKVKKTSSLNNSRNTLFGHKPLGKSKNQNKFIKENSEQKHTTKKIKENKTENDNYSNKKKQTIKENNKSNSNHEIKSNKNNHDDNISNDSDNIRFDSNSVAQFSFKNKKVSKQFKENSEQFNINKENTKIKNNTLMSDNINSINIDKINKENENIFVNKNKPNNQIIKKRSFGMKIKDKKNINNNKKIHKAEQNKNENIKTNLNDDYENEVKERKMEIDDENLKKNNEDKLNSINKNNKKIRKIPKNNYTNRKHTNGIKHLNSKEKSNDDNDRDYYYFRNKENDSLKKNNTFYKSQNKKFISYNNSRKKLFIETDIGNNNHGNSIYEGKSNNNNKYENNNEEEEIIYSNINDYKRQVKKIKYTNNEAQDGRHLKRKTSHSNPYNTNITDPSLKRIKYKENINNDINNRANNKAINTYEDIFEENEKLKNRNSYSMTKDEFQLKSKTYIKKISKNNITENNNNLTLDNSQNMNKYIIKRNIGNKNNRENNDDEYEYEYKKNLSIKNKKNKNFNLNKTDNNINENKIKNRIHKKNNINKYVKNEDNNYNNHYKEPNANKEDFIYNKKEENVNALNYKKNSIKDINNNKNKIDKRNKNNSIHNNNNISFQGNDYNIKEKYHNIKINKHSLVYFCFLVTNYMKKRAFLMCVYEIANFQKYYEKTLSLKLLFMIFKKRLFFYKIKFLHRIQKIYKFLIKCNKSININSTYNNIYAKKQKKYNRRGHKK